MNNIAKNSLCPPIWKLVFICGIAPFFALLPANIVPSLAVLFHTTNDKAEGVLTWFLLGYGIGPLIYGPIANRVGRKKALLLGFFMAILGMVLSLISLDLHLLPLMSTGRFITGIGASAGLIIGMVILNETNQPATARRKYSIIIMFFAFAPALAMATGGALNEHISTASVFILMPIIMLAIITISLTLKETYQGQPTPIEIPRLAKDYWAAFCGVPFIFLALIMATASSAMYVFNGLSPLVAINTLHISPEKYGELAIISSCGLFFGALLSSRLANLYSARKIMSIAVATGLLGSSMMLAAFVIHAINLYTLLIPAFLIFFSAAITIPNASMTALQSAKDPAIGASVINATALVLSSIILSASNYLFSWNLIALPGSLTILAILAFVFLKLGTSKHYLRNDH